MTQFDEDALTSLEESVGASLASHVEGACLSAGVLVDMAVLGNKSALYESGISHIATCSQCRKLLREFQSMESVEAAKANRGTLRSSTNDRPDSIPPGKLSWNIGLRVRVGAGAALALAAIIIIVPRRTVVALHDNGGEIRLTAAGDILGLPELPFADKQAVVSVLRTGRVLAPAVLATLKSSSINVADAFPVTAPRSTVVDTLKPEISWKMPANAVFCRVTLADETNPAQTVRSKPIQTENWTPKKPLVAGDVYAWKVVALDKSGAEVSHTPSNTGSVRFKVIESVKSIQLAHERTLLGKSHLAMGAIYAREGMVNDAEREFSALSSANPGSVLAKTMLESARLLRG